MPTSPPSPLLAVHLLGGFTVRVAGRSVPASAWRQRRAAAVVKLLALQPQHRLHRETLMETLWPELAGEAAANNLRVATHRARQRLEDAGAPARRLLTREGDDVVLGDAADIWVDVDDFSHALQGAWRAADPELVGEAAARYPGDLLPEDLFEDWVVHRRTDLRVSYLALLARQAQLAEEHGDAPAAIAATQRLLAAEPLDEAAHVHLMRLYAQLGAYPQALAQFDALAALLASELGTAPDASTVALRDDIRGLAQASVNRPIGAAFPEPLATPRQEDTTTVPDPDPDLDPDLLGRERELAELARLLTRHRLLTLVGPAGAGKTRLAEATLAAEQARGQTTHVVELGAITDPSLLPHAIAAVIGAATPEVETTWPALMSHIGASSLLLLLDNFEQLIQSAGLVADLLRACPRLSLIVTSREHLRLRAEHVYPVEPLALPDATLAPDDDLASYSSVRLFLRRAQRADPTFAPSPADLAVIADICRRLDGLPLAIELAAARARLLPPAVLLSHLVQPLALLTGGPRDAPARQQTMRAAIAWSVDLLPEATRQVFHRLGAFPGSFSLPAAEAVTTPQPGSAGEAVENLACLDVLGDLFDKHLLRRATTDSANPRFAMLTVIREYAAELLGQAEDAEATRGRHADFYQALAAAQAPRLTTAEVGDALATLEREAPNLRAALDTRLQAGDGDHLLRLGVVLWRYWWLSGHLTEGRAWLARALAAGDGANATTRAAALDADGVLAFAQGDFTAARERHLGALQLARQIGDERLAAQALLNLGTVADEQGLPHEAARYLDEALWTSRAAGDLRAVAVALANLGQVAISQADYPRAAALLNESALAFRDVGDPRSEAAILANLGLMSLMAGDPAAAHQCHAEALRIFQHLGDTPGTAAELLNLGHASQHLGNRDEAEALFLAARDHFLDLGDRSGIAFADLHLGKLALLRADSVTAAAYLHRALQTAEEIADWVATLESLEGLAMLFAETAEPARAAHALGVAEALREALGVPLPAIHLPTLTQCQQALAAALPPEILAASRQAGRAAAQQALGQPGTPARLLPAGS